jgi:hypothetical protein
MLAVRGGHKQAILRVDIMAEEMQVRVTYNILEVAAEVHLILD